MRAKLIAIVLIICLFVTIYSPAAAAGPQMFSQAPAAVLTVACDPANNATTLLIAAINAANANPDATNLELTPNCTYTLNQGTFTAEGETNGPNGLPVITTPITINGHHATIQRSAADVLFFRIIQVDVGGALTLNDLTIQNGNVANEELALDFWGGGILNYGGTLILNYCQFINNQAGYNGGGISNFGPIDTTSILTITNSTFTNNKTYGEGGGVFSNGILNVRGTTFENNKSTLSGGGLSNDDSAVIANSTFFMNTSESAAGAILNSGSLTLVNSTLSGNNSLQGIGGILTTDVTILENTIIANNDDSNCDALVPGIFTNGGGNLTWGDLTTPTCPGTVADPKLAAALAYNGGPTKNLALLTGSKALDAGDGAICAAAPVNHRDQRGYIRPNGAHCDSGAYEAGALPERKVFVPLAIKK